MDDRRFPYLNQASICGIVSRKPSLRTNKAGVATLKLSLTVSLPTLSDDLTSKRLSTVRVPVFIVGNLAVECERLLVTGSEIVVEGRLSSPPARGSVSRLEVHAECVQVVDSDGVLQFLVSGLSAEEPTGDSQTTATGERRPGSKQPASKHTPAKLTESGKPVSKPLLAKRPPEKPGATPAVTVPGSTVTEPVSKPKLTHGRRKRTVTPGLSATEEAVKPRRRRSVTPRPAAGGASSEKSVVELDASQKTASVSASLAVKPDTGNKRESTPRKPTTRRPRRKLRDVKDVESVRDGKSKTPDRAKRDGSRRDSSRSGSAKSDSAKPESAKSERTKSESAKSGSGSPFELADTDDTFDPFLLED